MVGQSEGDEVTIIIVMVTIIVVMSLITGYPNSSKIEIAIATSPVSKYAVDLYLELVTMTTKLEGTRCSYLYNYVSGTMLYWRHKLDDKISRYICCSLNNVTNIYSIL